MNNDEQHVPAQEVAWEVDKGKKRDQNQDSLAAITVNQVTDTQAQSVGVYAVADGMGGHMAGEVASKLAVRTAIRHLMDNITGADTDEAMPGNYGSWLERAVQIANHIIRTQAEAARNDMGTTLVIALVVGHEVHIANVGDSRAYIVSRESITQITEDHSFVRELIKMGAITEAQALDNPRRNLLTQAVGTEEEVQVDLFDTELNTDDYLLLCTDGLWDELTDADILRLIHSAPTPQAACQALIEAANQAGGRDNMAIVLVRLQDNAVGTS